MNSLSPVGRAVVGLAGFGVADQGVSFAITGKNHDKWEYKDKDNHNGNFKEYKIDWKGAKFDYKGDLHLHTHFISGTETTFCIHTDRVSGAFAVDIDGTTIAYDADRNITTDVAYELQKDDNSHVHYTLPFQLTPHGMIRITGAVELDLYVADYYEEGYARFKLVSAFAAAQFNGTGTLPDTLEFALTLGGDEKMISGGDLIVSWEKKDDKHWESR